MQASFLTTIILNFRPYKNDIGHYLKQIGIYIKFQVKRESSGRNVFQLDIISDLDLTSTSLGSKEAVSSINNAFKDTV